MNQTNEWPNFDEPNSRKLARRIKDWAEQNFSEYRVPFGVFSAGKQTPEELLKTGKVANGLGCLDLATVLGVALQKNGFFVQLVAKRVRYNGQPGALHFLIEAKKGDIEITLDPRFTKKIGLFYHWLLLNARDPYYKGKQNVEFQEAFRCEIKPEDQNKAGLQIARLSGRRAYIRQAGATVRGAYNRFFTRREEKKNSREKEATREKSEQKNFF